MRLATGILCLTACGARSGLLPPEPFDASQPSPAIAPNDATDETLADTGAACSNCALSFASGEDWLSNVGVLTPGGGRSPNLGLFLGNARNVCVTRFQPANCTGDALIYQRPDTPWTAGNSIPNAHWIWRGDVALSSLADFQVGAFEQTFDLGANPTGMMQIAVDDFAEVFVNGVSIGTTGSVTNENLAGKAQNVLVTLDLTPALQPGPNVVVVVAQNGPPAFGVGCTPTGCTYAQNPAGVIFTGTLRWK